MLENPNQQHQKIATPSFLILQGLATPFFKTLAHHLLKTGCKVHKVNYCGGDWFFSKGSTPGPMYTNHFGSQSELAGLYKALIQQHNITNIILFGDCRPIHKIAIEVAHEENVPVHVFEEGYTRPGWITMEQGGTNDRSPLPRTAEAIKEQLAAHPTPVIHQEKPALPNSMGPRVRMDLMFHAANILGMPFFRGYKTHRPAKVSDELQGWASRFWRKHKYGAINKDLVTHYEQSHEKYYLVPLQLNSDYQIREHSDYSSVPDFVREVTASFAKHAPKNTKLLFKSHPLDNGMIDYRSFIAMAGMQNNVADRLDYIEGGDLNVLLKNTAGTVMINSTVGYNALQARTPLKVMGRALYNIEGLAVQSTLDKFWKNPTAPDVNLAKNFIKLVRRDSQLYGDFFTKTGIDLAAKAASEKLVEMASKQLKLNAKK